MIDDEAKRDADIYNRWYADFGQFLKEGVVTDQSNKEALFKLLRFNSKKNGSKKMVSIDDYEDNM